MSSAGFEMVTPLRPPPASTGGGLNDHYPTPPQGPPELQAGAVTAAKSRITATTTTITATPTSSGPSTASLPSSASGATEFPLFGQLPPEIRLQIWRAALPPRTIELHSGRYSSHYARSTPAPWHSSSGNPAPLAACTEARQEALRRYYTVTLCVVSPARRRDFPGKPQPPPKPSKLSGGGDPGLPHEDDDNDPHHQGHHHAPRAGPSANPERRLYFDPQRDTLVILGSLEYPRLMALRANIARQDARGLRRLALTTGGFTRGSAGAELRVWTRVLLAGLDQFTLLLHDEHWPPEAAGQDGDGGHVAAVVVPCAPDDRSYVAFATSHGQYLGSGSGWIVVGCRNRRMQVAHLEFVRADGVRVG